MRVRDKRKSKEVPFADIADYSHFYIERTGEGAYYDLSVYQKLRAFTVGGSRFAEINAIGLHGSLTRFNAEDKVVPIEIEVMVVK